MNDLPEGFVLEGGGGSDLPPGFELERSKPAGYSLGPISDVAELGARGLNTAVQGIGGALGLNVGPPRQPQPMGQGVNLPFLGRPSAIGTAQGIYQAGKSGATLPGDVYAGKVDPLSEEGIRRATDLAALTQLPSVSSAVTRPATAAISASKLEDMAGAGYKALTQETRSIPVRVDALENLASQIKEYVNTNGPRPKVAQEAHAAIDDIAKTAGRGDLGDIIDSRKALAKIAREGEGENIAAAKMAVNQIDARLAGTFPDLVKQLRDLDKNYAIAKNAGGLETAIKDAVAQAGQAGTGGNVGNKIRQVIEKRLEKGKDEHLSPDVLAAHQKVTRPGAGPQTLRALSAFDPTHSKIGMMFGLGATAMSPFTFGKSMAIPAGGFASREMYDRIMKSRAAKVSEAIRAEAPATAAQRGYQPSGIVALPPPRMPSPTGILAPSDRTAPLWTSEGYPFYQR